MKKFSTPSMNIAVFDSHIVTDLSDIGANAPGVDQTTWKLLEDKFNARAVELKDIFKITKNN